ncbi:hypothetical protein Pmani_020707 [Petrolisthes manimaculis]|uniref:Uncharacterized protein n=1 Tax=Petrolisthes manimaculis TaxID=1843537 RepID=A0AAE1U2C3_9EUCA|nr:hypothetical protein Pmani_020707 [Petrolisthes manimaculis]
MRGVGATGLRKWVEPGVLDGVEGTNPPLGLPAPPPPSESKEDTDGGLLSNDLSPQSTLDETLDRSSLGVDLDKSLLDSLSLFRSDLDPSSLLRSDLELLSEV